MVFNEGPVADSELTEATKFTEATKGKISIPGNQKHIVRQGRLRLIVAAMGLGASDWTGQGAISYSAVAAYGLPGIGFGACVIMVAWLHFCLDCDGSLDQASVFPLFFIFLSL